MRDAWDEEYGRFHRRFQTAVITIEQDSVCIAVDGAQGDSGRRNLSGKQAESAGIYLQHILVVLASYPWAPSLSLVWVSLSERQPGILFEA